jgi:hypothetical protein
MSVGSIIQAVGEVDSPNKLNDMGIAGVLSLKYKRADGIWIAWNGWDQAVIDSPYRVVGVPPDSNNNIQISGNNGNPIPTDAPCP